MGASLGEWVLAVFTAGAGVFSTAIFLGARKPRNELQP
jgi:hypothetical protein